MVDWTAFSERVPVGTMVRGDKAEDGSGQWQGILLENKPYRFEDFIANIVFEDDKKLKRAIMPLRLGIQTFDETEESTVMFDFPDVQYFINDEWLTFEQVMALA